MKLLQGVDSDTAMKLLQGLDSDTALKLLQGVDSDTAMKFMTTPTVEFLTASSRICI